MNTLYTLQPQLFQKVRQSTIHLKLKKKEKRKKEEAEAETL